MSNQRNSTQKFGLDLSTPILNFSLNNVKINLAVETAKVIDETYIKIKGKWNYLFAVCDCLK